MTENARVEAERIVRELLRLSDGRAGESPQPFFQFGDRLVLALASAIAETDAEDDVRYGSRGAPPGFGGMTATEYVHRSRTDRRAALSALRSLAASRVMSDGG